MIGRAAKQARIFARQHGAAIAAPDVGHGVLAILFLDHVHQHAQRRLAQLCETAIEQGVAIVVAAKNIGVGELFAVEQIENGPIAADQEHARRRAAKNRFE